MTTPLISVVIPFCNHKRFLEEAIKTVLDQTYTPVELILVDDGSSDGSAALAKSYTPPATYIRRSNGGAGAARNTGIQKANGEFLAFCDADDLWHGSKLVSQIAAFRQDPSIEAVFASVTEFEDGGFSGTVRSVRTSVPGALPSAVLIRKRAFERVGPFAEGLRVGEWFDWYARMRETGLREAWLLEVLVGRRLHPHNTGLLRPESRVEYTRILRRHIRHSKLGTDG